MGCLVVFSCFTVLSLTELKEIGHLNTSENPLSDLQDFVFHHQQLEQLNPGFTGLQGVTAAPDGDADLERQDFHLFKVANCSRCGGIIKPDVVFFGDLIPSATRQMADQALLEADSLLVIGSSLMVYSGYRFCQQASQMGKPIAALNLGKTRADSLLSLKIEAAIGSTLQALIDQNPCPQA